MDPDSNITRTETASHASRPGASAPLRVTATDLGLPETVECPFCRCSKTELHAGFGSQLSVSTYWCHTCRTAFEYIKWQNASK